MSKNEALKIELDFLKVGFSALLVALFGIVSYAFVNYETLSLIMFLVLCFGLILVSVSLSVVISMTIRRIRELKNLKDKK